jgi:putative hydrolase of the HAD superfamily
MVKSLLFDFGGTLDADGTTWLDRFRFLYKEAGVESGDDRFAKAFYKADDELPLRHKLPGLSLEQTLKLQVADTLAGLGADASLRDKIAGRFLEDCRTHFRRNQPVLRRLAKRFKLGIVSNFYGNLDGILASEGLRDLFGVVADSTVVGASKPEAAIFNHALAALGSTAADALMVGDSLARDMRGAEGLGMPHAFLSQAAKPCCVKALRLKTFPELEPMLAEALAR